MRDEKGQIAILMVMIFPVIFLLFSLALDAGVFMLDHRLAQNQVDAATLAAVQHLPADPDTQGHWDAQVAVDTWLEKNGADPLDQCAGYPEFLDYHGNDGTLDTVRVCIRRPSQTFFLGLADLDFIYVSAVAGATIGPVGGSTVLPWGVVPPDPYCETWENCENDYADPGTFTDCGFFSSCPWGLDLDKLYTFKVDASGAYTPGNFGAIAACGGGVNNYRDCIEGEGTSGFFEAGEDISVGAQTGSGGGNTATALDNRYAHESTVGFRNGSPILECDVDATPDAVSGLDFDGREFTRDFYTDHPICQFRFVSLPILQSFPSGGASEDIHVLGIATFGIVNWDRKAAYGDPLGTAGESCGNPAITEGFPCGMVWGYLFKDVRPPQSVLLRINDTAGPIAPLMVALIE